MVLGTGPQGERRCVARGSATNPFFELAGQPDLSHSPFRSGQRRAQPLQSPHTRRTAMSNLKRGLLSVLVTAGTLLPGATTATVASAATGDGSVTDSNIAYVGRWDTSSATAVVPNWAGGYFSTGFTGTTVKVRARDAVNFYASIDGGADVFFAGVRGTVNLTPQPLVSGTHRLRVSYRSGDTVFLGLVLDPGARTVAVPLSPKLIEFVGD